MARREECDRTGFGRMKRCVCLILIFLGAAMPLGAHEMRPAYLAITETSAETCEVLWKVPARGEDQRLSLDVRFDPKTKTLAEKGTPDATAAS